MSLFDIFKTRWSAGSMTEDDRRKLFWYLKRKTSYTAWKREAEAFDRFAEIFEKQVKEEPVARDGPYKTTWDSFYPQVLKAQLLYEKGLDRLKQGDRSVWRYSDLGALRDAWSLANSWHCELVNHGMRGDHFHEGKYVEEMTEAIEVFYRTVGDAGYVQPRMADTPAPEFWGEWLEEELGNMPAPVSAPAVPEPATEILIRTGEEAPVFGIYEPQIKDGAMNYLLGGIPAPLLWGEDGTGEKLRVIWRLIWQDTRYLDGDIPAEEARYFPPEKSRSEPVPHQADDDLLSIATGQLCPKDGTWAVMDDLNARAVLKQGDAAPQYAGRDVIWVWAQ